MIPARSIFSVDMNRAACLANIPGYTDLERAFVHVEAGTFEMGAATGLTVDGERLEDIPEAPLPMRRRIIAIPMWPRHV
jgi:hypothetical protein